MIGAIAGGVGAFKYTGNSFSVNITTNPTGLTWGGGFFWVVDSTNRVVRRYTAAGAYDNFFFDVSDEANSPVTITFDGTNLRVLDSGSIEIYEYTTAGTYTGVHFRVWENSNARGIGWDGTHFWMVSNEVGVVNKFYEYTSTGSYTGSSYSANSVQQTPASIDSHNGNLWIVGSAEDAARRYTLDGSDTGESFSVAAESQLPSDLASKDGDIWVLDQINKTVYQYSK